MHSSNDKLIDEVKKRLLTIKKNKPISDFTESGVKYIEVRRLSTLLPRRISFESKRPSITRHSKINFLTEDKINLRLVPVIKSEKAIMRLKKEDNNNNKLFKTATNNINYSRNALFIKKPKKNNYNSNIFIKTFSNILSTSNSIGRMKTISKKHLFLSPFEEGKKRTKILKILVEFSKEIHSPKHKETYLINNNFNIRSFKNIKIDHMKRNLRDKFIFSKKVCLKKFKIKNSIFNENQKKKNNDISNTISKSIKKENNKIKSLLKRLDDGNDILKNKMMNKNKKIKPNCYYNKLHLNKINDIIDKYSYNNID